MKLIEEIYINVQRIVILLLRLALVLIILLGRILMRPLLSSRSITQKGVIIGFYLASLKLLFILL